MIDAAAFVDNDFEPDRPAAFCGVPTFTFFGPQLPEWFASLHPDYIFIEGKACPYKRCSDFCRFPTPRCRWDIATEDAWDRAQEFVAQHLGPHRGPKKHEHS